jgi:hypothetical protein
MMSISSAFRTDEFFGKYGKNGLVIYYPFFNAIKSGIIEIRLETIIIEAVKKDLWNLATDGRRDETIIINKSITRNGLIGFVTENELIFAVDKVKNKFRNFLAEGKSVYLEWSFAQNVDIKGEVIGESYLVFYECKSL